MFYIKLKAQNIEKLDEVDIKKENYSVIMKIK